MTFRARYGRDLGCGIGLRKQHYGEVPTTDLRIDWLEVTPENFARWGGESRRTVRRCLERWPVIPHSVCLSIGGPDPLDRDYLGAMKAFYDELDAPWWSDHICWGTYDQVYLHELIPLPFNEAAIAHLVPRMREAQELVGRPLALENPSYYVTMPGSTMDEAAFIRTLLEEADGGMLLDVNNVYVNAFNHGYDARRFIDALPLDRVVQIHLAGHDNRGDVIVDDHGAAVIDPVWDLYAYALERIGERVPTLIEWDNDVPSLERVTQEADRARAIAERVLAAPSRRAAAGQGGGSHGSAGRGGGSPCHPPVGGVR